tara:strand:- start:1558 stop:2328 length:771 start_codon:yes stop_codon:yes gene_type:complete
MIGNQKNVLGIIPARYNSSRLKGKPLALIDEKPMIQHVYERASKVLNHVVVATDDNRIADCVKEFGGQVQMTSPNHQTGTNRCLEAYLNWQKEHTTTPSVILNIQGDEPLLNEDHLIKIINCFNDTQTTIASLALILTEKDQLNPGNVYLVKDKNENAIYFSRNPIPFLRDIEPKKWTQHHTFFQHIGLYGFTVDALEKFCSLPEAELEKKEKLEQLRWLENGEKIKIAVTNQLSHPVDTIDDLNKVRELFKSKEK